jgi:hypothetical protein
VSKVCCAGLVTLLGLTLLSGIAIAATKAPSVTITLSPSLSSPQMLDTSVRWTATVQGGPPSDTYDYQLSAALQGQSQIMRDFDLANQWSYRTYRQRDLYTPTLP